MVSVLSMSLSAKYRDDIRNLFVTSAPKNETFSEGPFDVRLSPHHAGGTKIFSNLIHSTLRIDSFLLLDH